MKPLFITLTILFPLLSISQYNKNIGSAYSSGIGEISIIGNRQNTLGCGLGVQGISEISNISAGVINRFYLSELTTGYLSSLVVFNHFNIGTSFHRTGDEVFNQQHFDLSFSNSFDNIGLGIRLNYNQLSAENLSNKSTFLFDFGGAIIVSKNIIFATEIRGLSLSKSRNEYFAPEYILVGLKYSVTSSFTLHCEIEKSLNHDPLIKFGCSYLLKDFIELRSGLIPTNKKITFGFGINLSSKWVIDYGFIHCISISDNHAFSLTKYF